VILNKIMPEFDATPALCLAKEIRKRQTAGRQGDKGNFKAVLADYEHLMEIRYGKWLDAGNREMDFPC
jgi:hypothetical protein